MTCSANPATNPCICIDLFIKKLYPAPPLIWQVHTWGKPLMQRMDEHLEPDADEHAGEEAPGRDRCEHEAGVRL